MAENQPGPGRCRPAPANGAEFSRFPAIGSKQACAAEPDRAETIFHEYGLGVATHRDRIVYDFDRPLLIERVKQFVDAYNGEVDRYRRSGGTDDLDAFVRLDKIVWDRDLKKDLVRGRYAEFVEEKGARCSLPPLHEAFSFF